MAHVHTAYTCDICGAGIVTLQGQENDWECFNSSVLTFTDKPYDEEDYLDIQACGKCSAKIRNAIVSLQRDHAINTP